MHPAPPKRADIVPALSPAARRYLILIHVLSALLLSPSAAAQSVAEVQVTPETMTLGVGQKQALFATAFDSRGNILPNAKFTFRSSDTLVAQVRSDGTVIGIKPGLAKIEARAQGKLASMAVLITGGGSESTRPSPATVLTLEPASLTLFPGETARFRAQALKEDGTPVSIGRVTIKSLRPEVVRVDSGGLVTGLAPGRTIIQAAAGRLMATLPVEVGEAEFTVTPGKLFLHVEEIDTLRAMVPSQGNRHIRGLVQWVSTDSSIVSVSSAGVLRAHGAGQAEILARAGQQERRIPVTVHRVPDALVVSPPQGGRLPVPLNSTRQFTAVAEAADSTPIPEARVVWELSDTTVAAFDRTTGVLTPKALGTTTLTATLAGITPAVWTVHVTAGEIAIDPVRLGLLVAQRTTLSALSRDQDPATSSLKAGLQWSSDRPDVAPVGKNGMVEGVSPGHAVVTATTPWGKTATADVFVVGDFLLSSNRSGNFGIYQTTASNSSNFLPVLTDNASNIQAVFSPDRTRIAFSSNRNGNYDIYVMDSDGQRLRRLTSSPAHEGDPAWTPDGVRIVYTVTTGTTNHIAIMSSDGTEHRQLTRATGGNHSPTVSGDGRTIGFVSARDGNHAIYTMGLDGSNQRRVTRNSARETSPRFSRHGDLYYVTARGSGSRGSKVVRMTASGGSSQLLQTEDPISSLAVSRDGDRLVYVVGRIRDASRTRVDFSLFIQPTVSNRPPVAIPLQPGEQVSSPSF